MTKHKVTELSGALLDAAVAKIEGGHSAGGVYDPSFEPSTEWCYGGPIIERESIATMAIGVEGWSAYMPCCHNDYMAGGNYFDEHDYTGIAGPTPLVAAMRAFVTSKLGPEVDLP